MSHTPPQHIKNLRYFRQQYQRRLWWLFAGTQSVTVLAAATILIINNMVPWDNFILWMAIVMTFALGFGILLITSTLITEPLYEILAALAHKTGEPFDTYPPNPNAKHYEDTGFKAVLSAIYSRPVPVAPPPAPATSSQQFLTDALNHTSCGIVVLNPDKQIISANKAAPITHTTDGTTCLALDFLSDISLQDWLHQVDESAIFAERRWHRIATTPGFAKKTRYYDLVASYQKEAPGETVVLLIDRTDQYSPEEDDLNFIAFAAHELRGPITVIRGYLDVFEQELADRLRGDENELLQRLIVSASRLSSYVNNILNVSKFDRHHLRVHLMEDQIGHIYASIADDMQLRAQSQHRSLQVLIPDTLPTVAADRGSIQEVMSNLIDNAIKYSFEGGTVTLSAEQKGDMVEVSITDHGVGMPPNVVNNLFRKFYRSHRSREAVAGTGIGLYLCKAFVESHGGSISARSREGHGSVFAFTLPIYATIQDKLLEDGQLNRQLIRRSDSWINNHTMYRG